MDGVAAVKASSVSSNVICDAVVGVVVPLCFPRGTLLVDVEDVACNTVLKHRMYYTSIIGAPHEC